MIVLLLVGFLGGLVTGISPCILPVLPVIFASGAASGLDDPPPPAATPTGTVAARAPVAVGAVPGAGPAAGGEPDGGADPDGTDGGTTGRRLHRTRRWRLVPGWPPPAAAGAPSPWWPAWS